MTTETIVHNGLRIAFIRKDLNGSIDTTESEEDILRFKHIEDDVARSFFRQVTESVCEA